MPTPVRSFRYRGLKSLCRGVLAVAGVAFAAQVIAAEADASDGPAPTPKFRPNPEYPAEAMARNIRGNVELEFDVDEEGNVVNALVRSACTWQPPATQEQCAPDPSLTFVAISLAALAQWKYEPSLENGVPVQRHGVQTILRFNLQD